MALHFNKLFFLVVYCLMVLSCYATWYQPLFPYANGIRALRRDAVVRGRYKRLPTDQRPAWRYYHLHETLQLAHVSLFKAQADQQEVEDALAAFAYQVRVLLHEVPRSAVVMWHITAENGLTIQNLKNPLQRSKFYGQSVTVEYRNDQLFVNKHRIALDQLLIEPHEGHLALNGTHYEGSLLIMRQRSKAYCISQLDIESYICSVLRSESWPGWPIEVNKAFAIACRSYLVAKILVATKKGRPFHIKNTNIHQTYNGVHTNQALQQAVHETKGIILTHNKRPVEAMFDSCCGGVIPSHISGVDFKKAPYLARPYPCTYCKPCKIYTWHAEYTVHELVRLARKAGIGLTTIDDITVAKRDEAGLVTQLHINDGSKVYKLNGKQCYALFGKAKSFCFSLKKEHHKIMLTGRGYGHHLGLCQWGARRMLDHGASYTHILDFYYPDTEFMRLAKL